jgi:hypothetical protein
LRLAEKSLTGIGRPQSGRQASGIEMARTADARRPMPVSVTA